MAPGATVLVRRPSKIYWRDEQIIGFAQDCVVLHCFPSDCQIYTLYSNLLVSITSAWGNVQYVIILAE